MQALQPLGIELRDVLLLLDLQIGLDVLQLLFVHAVDAHLKLELCPRGAGAQTDDQGGKNYNQGLGGHRRSLAQRSGLLEQIIFSFTVLVGGGGQASNSQCE